MVNRMQFYIDGAWVDPAVKKSTPVVNPATEDAMYEVALGSKADLDKAVAAAKRAFVTYSQTSREERIALFEKIIEIYKGRMKDIGAAVSDEMGAPLPMAEHPDIDMISFTGSTRAGVDVAKRAAPTVKRVSQELGGKSPNVILEGADLAKAVTGGVMHMFNNSGQSCNAPSRMIVPLSKMKEVAAIAKSAADKTKAGDPRAGGTTLGPVVNRGQWDKIQKLIQKGT